MRCTVIFLVVSGSLIAGLAQPARADLHIITGTLDAGVLSWDYASRRSMKAQPNMDSAGRLHIKVKKGDIVRFVAGPGASHGLVFENGTDEKDTAWVEVIPTGMMSKLIPLAATDTARRMFYSGTADKVLTTNPPGGVAGRIIEIEIRELADGQKIFFACSVHSHLGASGAMMGVIELEK